MKEAYIKAVGIGLGFELQRAEFHYQAKNIWGHLAHLYIDGVYAEGWQFFLHKLDGNHWVSVSRPHTCTPTQLTLKDMYIMLAANKA